MVPPRSDEDASIDLNTGRARAYLQQRRTDLFRQSRGVARYVAFRTSIIDNLEWLALAVWVSQSQRTLALVINDVEVFKLSPSDLRGGCQSWTINMRYGSLPIKDYHTWASLNGIELDAARVVADILDKDGNSKGGGLVASRDVAADDVLLKVPAELIVCQSQVEQCAEVDGRLRELMDCMAEFTKVGP